LKRGGRVLLSIIPVVILWLLQQINLVPTGYIGDGLKGLAVLWVIVAVLTIFDPQYNDKIAAMKNIADLLPLPGKGKNP
jgi:hypothetical protein